MNEQTKSRALPRRQRIIRRPRLTRLLDEAAERCRILMLIAPAGYGKTTLAREWVDQGGRLSAWYTATAASSDVVALATGIAAAASEIVVTACAGLAAHVASTASGGSELAALPQL